jgi:hypothetical protein
VDTRHSHPNITAFFRKAVRPLGKVARPSAEALSRWNPEHLMAMAAFLPEA